MAEEYYVNRGYYFEAGRRSKPDALPKIAVGRNSRSAKRLWKDTNTSTYESLKAMQKIQRQPISPRSDPSHKGRNRLKWQSADSVKSSYTPRRLEPLIVGRRALSTGHKQLEIAYYRSRRKTTNTPDAAKRRRDVSKHTQSFLEMYCKDRSGENPDDDVDSFTKENVAYLNGDLYTTNGEDRSTVQSIESESLDIKAQLDAYFADKLQHKEPNVAGPDVGTKKSNHDGENAKVQEVIRTELQVRVPTADKEEGDKKRGKDMFAESEGQEEQASEDKEQNAHVCQTGENENNEPNVHVCQTEESEKVENVVAEKSENVDEGAKPTADDTKSDPVTQQDGAKPDDDLVTKDTESGEKETTENEEAATNSGQNMVEKKDDSGNGDSGDHKSNEQDGVSDEKLKNDSGDPKDGDRTVNNELLVNNETENEDEGKKETVDDSEPGNSDDKNNQLKTEEGESKDDEKEVTADESKQTVQEDLNQNVETDQAEEHNHDQVTEDQTEDIGSECEEKEPKESNLDGEVDQTEQDDKDTLVDDQKETVITESERNRPEEMNSGDKTEQKEQNDEQKTATEDEKAVIDESEKEGQEIMNEEVVEGQQDHSEESVTMMDQKDNTVGGSENEGQENMNEEVVEGQPDHSVESVTMADNAVEGSEKEGQENMNEEVVEGQPDHSEESVTMADNAVEGSEKDKSINNDDDTQRVLDNQEGNVHGENIEITVTEHQDDQLMVDSEDNVGDETEGEPQRNDEDLTMQENSQETVKQSEVDEQQMNNDVEADVTEGTRDENELDNEKNQEEIEVENNKDSDRNGEQNLSESNENIESKVNTSDSIENVSPDNDQEKDNEVITQHVDDEEVKADETQSDGNSQLPGDGKTDHDDQGELPIAKEGETLLASNEVETDAADNEHDDVIETDTTITNNNNAIEPEQTQESKQEAEAMEMETVDNNESETQHQHTTEI
ncbi:uncharacterized protein LOC144442712 [Glandiceps talaboti]